MSDASVANANDIGANAGAGASSATTKVAGFTNKATSYFKRLGEAAKGFWNALIGKDTTIDDTPVEGGTGSTQT